MKIYLAQEFAGGKYQLNSTMTEEFETKPEANITSERFKKQADEYLSKLEAYKKLDKEMKQYEANIKSYMVANDTEVYKNEYGRIIIDYVKVNCLNRALIDDIRQYYEETTRVYMRKTLNANKPMKTKTSA